MLLSELNIICNHGDIDYIDADSLIEDEDVCNDCIPKEDFQYAGNMEEMQKAN